MKALISALVLSAAAVMPVQAGLHDFTPENRRPSNTRVLTPGIGNCYYTPDRSHVCFLKLPNLLYSVAIHDKDRPGYSTSVFIDCKTGIWKSYGVLETKVVGMYMNKFCTAV